MRYRVIVRPTRHDAKIEEHLLIDPDPPPALDNWYDLPRHHVAVYIDWIEWAPESDDVDVIMGAHEPGARPHVPDLR